MKKFKINCDIEGQVTPIILLIGSPENTHNPIHFQSDWLSKQRQINISAELLTSLKETAEIAEQYKINLDILCLYALGLAAEENNQIDKESSETKDTEKVLDDDDDDDFDDEEFDDEELEDLDADIEENDLDDAEEDKEGDKDHIQKRK